MDTTITCISCPMGCQLTVKVEDTYVKNVAGASCSKGKAYAETEITNPVRMVTSTVPVRGSNLKMISVKTQKPIPKGLIFDSLKSLIGVEKQAPVRIGDVVVKNVCGTGVDIIVTRGAELKDNRQH